MDPRTDLEMLVTRTPPISPRQKNASPDLEEIDRLEDDLARRARRIARWTAEEEFNANHPTVGGKSPSLWRQTILGWLGDPLLTTHYNQDTLRGLQMAIGDFGDEEVSTFVWGLLQPNRWR